MDKSLTKQSLNIKTLSNKKNNNNETSEKEDFYIEIKNEKKISKKNDMLINKQKLKQIFLKNGLHIYNFNEDGINVLNNNEKFEAKLRKNKEDINFAENYRKVVRELNKINVKVNRKGMVYDNCIFNKNSKIRKGTPGKGLNKNIKLNYAIKRDKYVQPITNQGYKNGYKYNLNFFDHHKKELK